VVIQNRLSYSTDHEPLPISTLSLHDALPICSGMIPTRPFKKVNSVPRFTREIKEFAIISSAVESKIPSCRSLATSTTCSTRGIRSEEHTSELQSRFDLVCRLLREQKEYGMHL